MKLIPQKVIHMTLLLCALTFLFSCSKDTDLLLDSVLNDPEVALEEKEQPAEELEEVVENGLVTRSFTFSPTNDAYLQNEQGHDQSIIRLQEDYRTSYLMFDLSQVNGTITDAVLQFSIDSDEGDGAIDIHKGISTDWTEETLTINNAPSLTTQLGSMNKTYKIGTPEKVALDANNLEAEITTLVMTHSTGNDLAFASKEHPAKKGPKLVITYKALEGSPLIEQQAEEDTTPEVDTTQNDTTPPQEEDTPPVEDPATDTTASTEGAYYVTTSGSATNNGLSEATAWSIEHAFETAVAGDVVYIKAGDYGNKELDPDNSGAVNKPIKFIGYTNTPGDLVSDKGSTFKYGDVLDSKKMPLLSSPNRNQGAAFKIFETYIHIENFQITGFRTGVLSHSNATHFTAKNIIITEMGTQSNFDAYDGWGLNIQSNNAIVENCFVLNAAAEAIKLYATENSRISYSSVYADNPSNPTDYYFFITGGATNNIVEYCYAERASALSHNGHGFNIKNDGSYNLFKNCIAKRTSFELTYYGVHHNTIDGGAIYGVDTSAGNWHARMSIIGGAHDNVIKNLTIENTHTAIALTIYNDRTGLDASMGNDNVFDNVTIKNTNRILGVGGGTNYNAKTKRNIFKNCNFSDFDAVAVAYYEAEDFEFKSCSFTNGTKFVVEVGGNYAPYSNFDATWTDCTWQNVGFTPPN